MGAYGEFFFQDETLPFDPLADDFEPIADVGLCSQPTAGRCTCFKSTLPYCASATCPQSHALSRQATAALSGETRYTDGDSQ